MVSAPLLAPDDTAPFELVNSDGSSPVLLVCEHAGRRVPKALGGLGIPASEMDRHIAWDVGAAAVARMLSDRLDAALLLQPYSRLVIDCNRPLEAADCIPEVSDGTPIPANRDLDEAARRSRFDSIHTPFHDAVAELIDRRLSDDRPTILIAVHSFVPQLRVAGIQRPWHVGLLFNRNDRLARALMQHLTAREPDLPAAFNEPYQVDDFTDYTIPVHGEARGIDHVLAEIRHDLIADPPGQERWAALFASAIGDVVGRSSSTARPRSSGSS